ncbi:MAG: CvpA family protein [Ramlibacter sp.]
MTPNPVDILLVLIVLIGAWGGWRRGFLFAGLDLLTLVVSLVAAFVGYRYSVGLLERMFPPLGVWVAPLSFVGTFLLVHLVLAGIALSFVRRLPDRVHGNVVNRVLGLAPGVVNGAIHATVAAVLLLILPLGAMVGGWTRDSALAGRFSAPAEWVEVQLAPIFDPAIQRSLQALTVPTESRNSIALPVRVTNAEPAPELEARMLTMVNAERTKQGLQPLKPDPELTQVARAHSRDMFERAYFSHVTPEGRELSHRMRQARLGYLAAGENLALAPTLSGAHQGLMNSPGHRANILRPQFGRAGIGVLDGGIHGLMVTQNFRN